MYAICCLALPADTAKKTKLAGFVSNHMHHGDQGLQTENLVAAER